MTIWDKYAQSFENPQGPGDDRPAAMQIIRDEGLEGKMKGCVVVITGGSSGIGVETVRAIHATGAQIVLPVRNQEKGQATVKKVQEANKDVTDAGSIELMSMDLNSLQSVRSFAQAFKKQYSQLNMLINNAGVAFVEGKTSDGFERHIGTNHLAHFVLFDELKDLLLQSSTPEKPSRVVVVASDAHLGEPTDLDDLNFEKGEFQAFKAYCRSKTANIWFANEAERRYGSQGLHVLSVHPGVIRTELEREMDSGAVKDMFSSDTMQRVMATAEQGAACTIWAALAQDSAGIGLGGVYCVNCRVAPPAQEGAQPGDIDPGYASYAYNAQSEKRLWELSEQIVAKA